MHGVSEREMSQIKVQNSPGQKNSVLLSTLGETTSVTSHLLSSTAIQCDFNLQPIVTNRRHTKCNTYKSQQRARHSQATTKTLCLYVVDGARRLDLRGNCLTNEGLDEYLHTSM